MRTKPPFTRKAGLSYNIPCGAAGWPLCRCLVHLRRFAGVGAPASCRIFVFQAKYSTARTPLQAFSSKIAEIPPLECSTGKRTDCHSQCAHWLRNDRDFHMGCGARPFSGRPGGRPLHTSIVKRSVGADAHIGPVAPALKKSVGGGVSTPRRYPPAPSRRGVGTPPYGSATRCAERERPRGSPLRMIKGLHHPAVGRDSPPTALPLR